MEKRYQVFVSSTYEDLKAERQEVMHALLELDCIPAGMELFQAANEDQWSLIRKVIDECDYYVVISAGRYGSIGPQGYSYTEMEYRYAIEIGKPVIAFLHKDPLEIPAALVEQSDDGKAKHRLFRELLQKKMCKFWRTPAELGSVVSRSLIRLTKTTPAVGWIKADQVPDTLDAVEVLKLRKTIESLEAQLQQARTSAPAGTEKLSQGTDTYNVAFTFDTRDLKGDHWSWNYDCDLSWNALFYDIGPIMINEATDRDIWRELNKTVKNRSSFKRQRDKRLKGHTNQINFEILEHDFQTIKIQLRALGLIGKSTKTRSIKDVDTYWTLTPYGDQVLTTLRAIEKDEEDAEMVDEDTEANENSGSEEENNEEA